MGAKENSQVIYLGIDLGTSRSSVTSSDGVREFIESYVGWPADMVARKVLKDRKVLIGTEALESRAMLDLHRPLERGLIKEGSEKDSEAIKVLLRHLVHLAGVKDGKKDGKMVRAVIGVPAEAMRVNKQQLRGAMKGIVDSLMIISEPFAVAYGLEALLHALVIDIGAGTTDFCVMNGRYPTEEDQRTLTSAGDSVDLQLRQAIAAKYPEATFSEHMVREWKESYSFVGDPKEKIVVTAPVQGKPTELDITEAMRTACESLVPPIVETMLDLISRVQPEFQEKVRNNVILSGGGALITNMGAALQDALKEIGGGQVRVVKDPVYVGAEGGLSVAQDAPQSDWEKLPA